MRSLPGNQAHFEFESKPLGPGVFHVTDFAGEEAISRPYRFEINLVSSDPDIEFARIINQPASFTLRSGVEKTIYHGVVADFVQLGTAQQWYGYRAVLVPRLWLLSLNYQSRVFQNLDLSEILQIVLNDSGFLTAADYEFRIGNSSFREYCVQYNESDLDFVSRLLEFDGISYFFEQNQKDVLVISDDSSSGPRIEGDPVVTYNEGAGLEPQSESVRSFVSRERIVPGTFQVRDYHYVDPEAFVAAESRINGQMPGTRYEYGGGLLAQSDGDRIAAVRNEEAECRRRVFEGESDCARLVSGRTFSVEDHFRKDLNANYLITEVRHRGSQTEAIEGLTPRRRGEEPERDTYENTFTCIPADVAFRPLRATPIPRIGGIISAKVESAGGKYAYLDDHGRYRVRMPFDRGDAGKGSASLPVPHVQINSGPDAGVHFPIHETNDLLLAFMDGDVNRPFAIGSLPTPVNNSPVTSNNNAQNVVRTPGGNELVMDDTENSAQIWLRTAQGHHYLMDDAADRVVLTTTEKHQLLLDDANRAIEVKTKDGHFARMDDDARKITFQSKDGHRISINDADKLITLVDESGDHLFQIDMGSKQLTIKTKTGGIDLQAPDGLVEIKAKSIKMESSAETKMKAGTNVEIEASADMKTKAGANMTNEAAMNYTQKGLKVASEATTEHSIKGLQVKAEASVSNDVSGTLVNVKASGMNTIQGALVKIN